MREQLEIVRSAGQGNSGFQRESHGGGGGAAAGGSRRPGLRAFRRVTGSFEAAELRDGGSRYGGLGTKKAAEYVSTVLAEAVLFENAMHQKRIDRLLREADGTENKGRLGANAILSVSPGSGPGGGSGAGHAAVPLSGRRAAPE